MVASLPTMTDRSVALRSSGISLSGKTAAPATGMLATDTRELKVDSRTEGRFTFTLKSPFSAFEVRDRRGELVAFGRNGGAPKNIGVYLASGDYTVKVSEDNPRVSGQGYALDIKPRKPQQATVIFDPGGKVEGATNAVGQRGMPSDTRLLQVDEAGDYNLRLDTPHTTFEVRNSGGKVVAAGSTDLEPSSVKAHLVPGETYTTTVTQKMAGTSGRAYSLDVSKHINATITMTGGMIIGTSKGSPTTGVGTQTHSLRFAADGEYNLNLLLPGGSFSLKDAGGNEVATGTNKGAELSGMVTADVKAGAYSLTVKPPIGSVAEGWTFMVDSPGNKDALAERQPLSKVEQLLMERDVRVQRWNSVNIKA